jgi:hypothetical protein
MTETKKLHQNIWAYIAIAFLILVLYASIIRPNQKSSEYRACIEDTHQTSDNVLYAENKCKYLLE